MMSCEERYEYVLRRCGEIKAERRKKRVAAAKIAAPVCGAAVVATGIGAVTRYRRAPISENASAVNSAYADASVSEPVSELISAPKAPEKSYVNFLNIGKVEVSADGIVNFFCVGGFIEWTREDTLAHFGLSPELDLSGVIDGFKEVPWNNAPNALFQPNGKYGFIYNITEESNGKTTTEFDTRYDHQVFKFENSDGTKWADVFFCRGEAIPWWINGGIDDPKREKLPISVVADTQMRIGERSNGGYYAEFNTPDLSVGLMSVGCSEEETVDILEYLAEYVGVGGTSSENVTSVGAVSVNVPESGDVTIVF